ncbi:Rab-related GTPase family protein [Ceratobasidium sp. AG-Ba]|nr:Rab-related GTPase family protein [Ceratobasidium sp. AG-Ba]
MSEHEDGGATEMVEAYDFLLKFIIIGEAGCGKSCLLHQFTQNSYGLTDARALASSQLVTVMVGNKTDREEDREVEWSEASKWAAENGAFYLGAARDIPN